MAEGLAPGEGRLPKKAVLFVCFRQKLPKHLIHTPICRFVEFCGAFLLLLNSLYMRIKACLLLLWGILFYILAKYQIGVGPQTALEPPQKTALNPNLLAAPRPSLLKGPQCLLVQRLVALLFL